MLSSCSVLLLEHVLASNSYSAQVEDVVKIIFNWFSPPLLKWLL